MENKYIRTFLVVCMGLSLGASFNHPEILAGFGIAALLLFGVIYLDDRNHDRYKQLSDHYFKLNNAVTDMEPRLKYFEDIAQKLDGFDVDKTKAQLQTLIDSNNQLVLNMRNMSGGTGF